VGRALGKEGIRQAMRNLREMEERNKMDKRIEDLRAAELSDRDRNFADSLLDQYERTGGLSDKQWYWVVKLAGKSNGGTEQLGDCKVIFDLLTRARAHLKWPKIVFHRDGRTVQMKMAGERSRYAGKVLLTDGRPFGSNEWYGYIEPNGVWVQPSRGVPGDVQVLVKELAADPVKAAADYGHLTGQCCFCNLPLTDARSTTVGYGPVCAGHFGLPWGKQEVTDEDHG